MDKTSISRQPLTVKAEIANAHLRLCDLAAVLDCSRSLVTKTVAGQRRCRATQVRIWRAYSQLASGRQNRVGLAEFWGVLLEE